MLNSFGIDRKLTWLIAFVSIGASYRPLLAQGTGCVGDLDADGDVDLLDYAEFSVCFSSSGGESGADCTCFDLDDDDDIDLADFTFFSQEFTGPPRDCPPSQTDCDGTCVSTANDNANCGGCGNTCPAETTCDCGGACVDLMWDSRNCGFCGNLCNPQDYCAWGSCVGYCIGCEPPLSQAGAVMIRGDFDEDGDVDLLDLAEFQTCALDPAISQTDPVCTDARLDADEDVDLDDFAVFHRCFSGADNPADPNCACPSGQADCGGACVDLMWNGFHCGACSNICPPLDHCSWGQCEGSCIGCE